jgi:hypothetical protein
MKTRILTGLVAGAMAFAPLGAQTSSPARFFRDMATSDPNRDPNWPFWVNQPYAFYFNRTGAIQQAQKTVLPYFDGGYKALVIQGKEPDVFPEDGWMLVMRDFGTPTAAPAFPYFALYNKYRGILRLFILNTWELDKQYYTTSTQFYSSQPEYHAGLMTFPAPEKTFLKDYDPNQSLMTLSNMSLSWGWSHYDFILAGYDPNLKNKPNAALYVRTNGVNESSLDVNGSIYGSIEQTLNNAPVTFSRSDMEAIEAALKKGASYYKNTEEAMKGLKAATEDPGNSGKWWLSTAVQLVAAFYSGGTTEYASWIAGAVGFVTEFIGGGNKVAPMQPMKFKAQLALKATGSITSTTWIDSSGFFLNYKAQLDPGQNAPVQVIPWGVFNVEAAPEVMVQKEYLPDARVWYEPDANPAYYWVCKETYPKDSGYHATVAKQPNLLINPDMGMAVQSVKMAYTYGDSAAPSPFTATPLTQGYSCWYQPSGLTYELKFDLPNAANLKHSDPTQVFYKTVPVKTVVGPDIGWFDATTTRKKMRGTLPN